MEDIAESSLELKPDDIVENGGLENEELGENGASNFESASGENGDIGNSDINGNQVHTFEESQLFEMVSI